MKIELEDQDNFINDYRLEIGNALRKLREKKGYSQNELAEKMEVHPSTISKVENGKFAITIDYLAKFAWYLDFNLSLIENLNSTNIKIIR